MFKFYNSSGRVKYLILLLFFVNVTFLQAQIMIGYSVGNYLGHSLSNIDCMAEQVSFEQNLTTPINANNWNRGLKISLRAGNKNDNAFFFCSINPYRSHYFGEGIDPTNGTNKRYDFKLNYTVIQFAGMDIGEPDGPGFGFSCDLDKLKLKYKIDRADDPVLEYEEYYKGITVGYSIWARFITFKRANFMLTYSGVLLNAPMKNHSYYYKVSNLSFSVLLMIM